MQAQTQTAARFAFKPQAKSNAKRFLVKTNKVAEADVPLYLTEVDGQWGTYIDADGKPSMLAQVEAEKRINAPAITTADAAVETPHFDAAGVLPTDEEMAALGGGMEDEPATTAGFGAFAAMVTPVAAPAGQASTVVRDGKVIDPNAPNTERADKAVAVGDACPLCGAEADKQTAATEGVSQHCAGCEKTYSMATGREVRAGYKREDVNRGYTIEKNRAEQNGVKRPSAGTLCGQVWAALDVVHATHMPVAADLDNIASANGWNRNNVSCEFYQWRKFNGIKGRQVRAK